MKYCIRLRESYQGYNGAKGDTIWMLDDDFNYIDSMVGWPKKFAAHTYTLHRKNKDGEWRNAGEIDMALCNVPIRRVKCKWDSQERAIQRDLREGILDGLY